MSGRKALSAVAIVAVTTVVALQLVGGGLLAPPPLGSWRDVERWYAARDTATVIVALLRGLAMLGAAWLATAAGLQILVGVAPVRALREMADAVSPAFLRALSSGAAGLSMTAGLVVPSFAGPVDNPPGTAVMVPLDHDTTTTTDTTVATPVTVPPPASTTTSAPPRAETPVTAPASPAPEVEEVVVLPGASFWSIAEDEARGRDVVSYWRHLIEANGDRLVDPRNPDLLYTGQVLRLPPLR